MTRIFFIPLLIAGVVSGFAAGLLLLPDSQNDFQYPPIDKSFKFSALAIRPETLVSGWRKPNKREVWSNDKEAVLALDLGWPASDNLEIIIDARSKSESGNIRHRLAVKVNRFPVGYWELSDSRPEGRRRFLISKEIANLRQPMQVSFADANPQKQRLRIALRSIEIRTFSLPDPLKGHVDRCTPKVVSGWAVGGVLGMPVLVKANGRPVKGSPTYTQRPDLKVVGLNTESGFSFAFKERLHSGDWIEVVFPNGRHLANSPCKL